MATFTAGDLITRALRILGILAEGETPSAETSADALVVFCQMLDSWSTERLSVFATNDQQFTWAAGLISRTLGPTGDFTGVRPVLLDDATYYVYSGISYPIEIINEEQYNSIALKTSSSTIPQYLFVNMDFPNITMKVYPVPSTSVDFHFISVAQLDQPALLSTNLTFPPGYLEAFVYNLAVIFAPEFGTEAPATVKRIAGTSKRNIKRINNPEDVMSIPSSLLSNYVVGGNIYNGWQ